MLRMRCDSGRLNAGAGAGRLPDAACRQAASAVQLTKTQRNATRSPVQRSGACSSAASSSKRPGLERGTRSAATQH